jgi:hypothetical protein
VYYTVAWLILKRDTVGYCISIFVKACLYRMIFSCCVSYKDKGRIRWKLMGKKSFLPIFFLFLCCNSTQKETLESAVNTSLICNGWMNRSTVLFLIRFWKRICLNIIYLFLCQNVFIQIDHILLYTFRITLGEIVSFFAVTQWEKKPWVCYKYIIIL